MAIVVKTVVKVPTAARFRRWKAPLSCVRPKRFELPTF
jgi:hypothetical protein